MIHCNPEQRPHSVNSCLTQRSSSVSHLSKLVTREESRNVNYRWTDSFTLWLVLKNSFPVILELHVNLCRRVHLRFLHVQPFNRKKEWMKVEWSCTDWWTQDRRRGESGIGMKCRRGGGSWALAGAYWGIISPDCIKRIVSRRNVCMFNVKNVDWNADFCCSEHHGSSFPTWTLALVLCKNIYTVRFCNDNKVEYIHSTYIGSWIHNDFCFRNCFKHANSSSCSFTWV